MGVHLNPHIKRLPAPPVDQQLDLLKTAGLTAAICYPEAQLIKRKIDISQFDDRPFTKRLVLGAPQLEIESFETSVLDRYINDPRYHCNLGDYAGHMSIGSPAGGDDTFPERDKVFLQTFGLGYTESGRRVIVVFLRYLSSLSAEHQQAWNSYRILEKTKMLKEYYENTILGEIAKNVSYFTAIKKEIQLVNQITKAIVDRSLFLQEFEKGWPVQLSFFRMSTLKNFNEFLLAFDQVLSENLNVKFFEPILSIEEEIKRKDGKVVVRRKGTVSLLEEWVRKCFRWNDVEGAVTAIVNPFREVRRLRQKPAHSISENAYSAKYEDEQHRLLGSIYGSVSQLRHTLASHPQAPDVEMPAYLKEGNIVFF